MIYVKKFKIRFGIFKYTNPISVIVNGEPNLLKQKCQSLFQRSYHFLHIVIKYFYYNIFMGSFVKQPLGSLCFKEMAKEFKY